MNLTAEELWEIFESSDPQRIQNVGGVSTIAKNLQSDPINGLDQQNVSHNIAKYGTNMIPDRPIPSFYDMLKEALRDQTLIILIICAIISLILEFLFAPPEERSTAWIDGTAILMAVAIVSVVQAYNNQKQEIQFSSINRVKSIFDVAVIRNGQLIKIKNTELVVGDIIQVDQGDKIPADCLLLEAQDSSILVDQSSATGESNAVRKNDSDPFFISNTHITIGRAKLLVICVGVKSHNGRIFALLNDEHADTPLQEKLEALALKIGAMGIFVATLTFVVLFIEWIVRCSKKTWKWSMLREPLSYFIIAITIIACAVPEGLPLAVTISLAYSMQKMMKDNNFVRHLSACETMGSATIICTDKTGTLTQNQMNVEEVIIGQHSLSKDTFKKENFFTGLLKKSLSINTHAVVNASGEIGSQTECAIVRFVSFMRENPIQVRNSSKIVQTFEFDRTRKKMSTVEQLDNNYVVYVKGAPDEIIPKCNSYYNDIDENNSNDFDENSKQLVQQQIDEQSSRSYRCLAVAYKKTSSIPETSEEAESDLTLLCILCIRDSLRKNTIKSIQNCQRAGIRIIMVTGDYMLTAEAIAKECNILTEGKIAITGAALRSMSEEELIDQLPMIAVVARSTPLDKHLLVTHLQKMGEIVGVTGDGTNDVAALMAADVGLAMGKCGTELAKEASDIVILDDDFRSIVKSVVWGRCIYNNIQRFLQFQLTANVSTLFISFISAVILSETPFKAVQLLWVNLIMDSLGALSLATGKPHDNLLEHKPQNKDTPLITSFMISNIFGQATLQIALIGLILIFPGDLEQFSQYHYTFLFNVFVLAQAFNLLNARATEKGDDIFLGVFDTPLFFTIMFGIMIVQWVLVQVAGPFFSCTPLKLHEWVYSTLLASLSLPVGFIVRHFGPSSRQNFSAKRSREDDEPLLQNE